MSRITAVFTSDADAQAALRDLRALGISDQHLIFSHRSAHAGTGTASSGVIRPDTDGTVNADQNVDTGTHPRHEGVAFIPPVNNTVAPTSMGGVGVPLVAAALVTETMRDNNDVNPVLHNEASPERESRYYDDALRDGHFLISVDAEDALQEEHARDVLARNHGAFYTP